MEPKMRDVESNGGKDSSVTTRRNLLNLSALCTLIVAHAAQSQSGRNWQAAAGGKIAFEAARKSSCVSNHFQFNGCFDGCKELIDARHRRLFQLGITALAALQYR